MPKLVLKFNKEVVNSFPLRKKMISIGRTSINDVVIAHPAVSTKHCQIVIEGNTYYVADLSSTNGTFVNDKRIKKTRLRHNDIIRIARHTLLYLEENPSIATKKNAPSTHLEITDITPRRQKQFIELRKSLIDDEVPNENLGKLKVVKGSSSKKEYFLKAASVYIGSSDRAQIKVKGGGLFDSAPGVAAVIHKKPRGYLLAALVPNYPVVNGKKIAKQTALKNGDMILCGDTTFLFTI